jgi:adenosine kinase
MQILDPTGVGDAFRGGFVRAVRLGLDWETCGRGWRSGSYLLPGSARPAGAFYTLVEFVARYRQHFDDNGALDVLFAL